MLEFQEYLKHHDIEHIKTSLYFPQSNGAVERWNRTLKNFIQTSQLDGQNIKRSLYQFLQVYRSTPQDESGLSPSLLLHGRQIKTKLEIKRPEKKVRFNLPPKHPFKVGMKVRLRHPRMGKIIYDLSIKKLVGDKTVILSNDEKWHVSFLAPVHKVKHEDKVEDGLLLLPDTSTERNLPPPQKPKRNLSEVRQSGRKKTPSFKDPNFIYF